VLLRWGQAQLPLKMLQHLLFGQAVALDRGRGKRALGQIEAMELCSSFW